MQNWKQLVYQKPPNSPSSNQDDKKVVELKANLAREQKVLEKLAAQTKNLQASTKSQEEELASIKKESTV
jgi:septal ring factor EnvC (AmiA/AmiB activator)